MMTLLPNLTIHFVVKVYHVKICQYFLLTEYMYALLYALYGLRSRFLATLMRQSD